MTIPKPDIQQVASYLEKWKSQADYELQEHSLRKLFDHTYPANICMDDVLIKVCAVNAFYSTQIRYLFAVAQRIVSLNIDEKLANDDLDIVNQIAKVEVKPGKFINYYSFATKYCSHHKPTAYPIYDSYVEKVLVYFKKQDGFSGFELDDLRQYPKYRKILLEFRSHYRLDQFNLKEIDQYLWQLGKEYFSQYKKREA